MLALRRAQAGSRTAARTAPHRPAGRAPVGCQRATTAAAARIGCPLTQRATEGTAMPIEGEYVPGTLSWAADQVELYERTGGAEGNDLQGRPVIILTTRGRKTGKVRKSPLMRVKHGDRYAVVASLAGAPQHPVWYLNML